MSDAPPDPAALLAREAAWRPSPGERPVWEAAVARAGAPEPLARELRWWRAHDAARARAWDEVSRLAEEGLAEPFSEREAVRLALLHCLSGSIDAAEHVVAQAVQTVADEGLPRRLAAVLAREGLHEAARRFG